jgi:hypothetical protein
VVVEGGGIEVLLFGIPAVLAFLGEFAFVPDWDEMIAELLSETALGLELGSGAV